MSKWALAESAISLGTPLARVGVCALLISALLTAFYMFTVVVRAYFPRKTLDLRANETVHEADALMTVPMLALAVCSVAMGLWAQPLTDLIAATLGL